MMKNTRKLRYAVVGLGHIAQVAVLPAFKNSKNSELVALVSGDADKLRKLGRRYRIPRLYDYSEFDECLENESIDAVYIALPNSMHEDFAIRAARAGVHILCEKPLAVTSPSAERIIRAAKQGGVELMVAYRLHFDPVNLKAIQIAHSGKIGEPRYFTSEFGYQLHDDNIRAISKEGGTPLHDIGIYCINATRYLFKEEPIEVFAMGVSPAARPAVIQQTVVATLRFPDDRVASFTCSFGSAAISNYRIVGSKGDLFIENAYEYVGAVTQHLTVGGKTKTWKTKPGDQFAAELDYFADCVKKGRSPEPSGNHGLVDLRIIEALMKSLHTGRPVSLGSGVPRTVRRPTMAQRIKRPAHAEPELIHVEQPSRSR